MTPTTVAATTEPPTTEATTTTSAASDETGGTTWWPWGLLAVAAVAVIAGILLAARARKPVPWTDQTAAALDESDRITTGLVGLSPQELVPVAGPDAARLAGLMASIHELAASGPDDASSHALAAVEEPLRSLHGILDAVALAGTPPSIADTEQVTARANELHRATSMARDVLAPPPAPPV